MRLWALALCAACLAAEVLIACGKTHRFADHVEARQESIRLKKQTREERKAEFHQWKQDFKKTYGSLEEEERTFDVWNANVEEAADLNLRAAGTVFYGANELFGMTPQEWADTYLMHPTVLRRMRKLLGKAARPKPGPTPPAVKSWDWRASGKVTNVKDQGGCGSCWAFGQGAAIESKYLIQTGKAFDVSEQQFNDCLYGRDGCQGGWGGDVYYFAKTTPVCPEGSYGYYSGNSGVSGTCQTCPSAQRLGISGNANLKAAMTAKGYLSKWPADFNPWVVYTAVNSNAFVKLQASTNAIADFVAAFNPVSFDFTVYNDFFYYSGGIYVPHSNQVAGGHLVLLVGYNMSASDSNSWYWIAKNSWGLGWGESGYFRIQVTTRGSCDMYANVHSPGDIVDVAPSA